MLHAYNEKWKKRTEGIKQQYIIRTGTFGEKEIYNSAGILELDTIKQAETRE